MKYICTVCGWEYDESVGYPEGGISQQGRIKAYGYNAFTRLHNKCCSSKCNAREHNFGLYIQILTFQSKY